MDLEPKYIEDNIFEVEEWFAKGLLQLSIESQTEIVEDLVSVVNLLPITDGWEQKIYGVILNEDILCNTIPKGRRRGTFNNRPRIC